MSGPGVMHPLITRDGELRTFLTKSNGSQILSHTSSFEEMWFYMIDDSLDLVGTKSVTSCNFMLRDTNSWSCQVLSWSTCLMLPLSTSPSSDQVPATGGTSILSWSAGQLMTEKYMSSFVPIIISAPAIVSYSHNCYRFCEKRIVKPDGFCV